MDDTVFVLLLNTIDKEKEKEEIFFHICKLTQTIFLVVYEHRINNFDEVFFQAFKI